MSARFKGERVLAVVGAAALVVVGFDGLTYAATGSSLIMGAVNTASTTTAIRNTGTGPALRLVTSSSTEAPFTTNGTGLVSNLYAARAANADKVAGRTMQQIKSKPSFAVNDVSASTAIALTQNFDQFTPVVALRSTNTTTRGALGTAVPTTLMIDAAVTVRKGASSSNLVGLAQCRTEVSRDGGAFTPVGAPQSVTLDNGISGQSVIASVGLVSALPDAPAGTYDVRVACGASAVDVYVAPLKVTVASVNVVAVPV